MDEINRRIEALRQLMVDGNLDACYISGTDPHMSEYLPGKWKTREFITGFNGSFGEVLITHTEAFLWTDTRYFIQAENQLKGTGIKMQKLRVPGAITIDQWLAENLKSKSRVGIDFSSTPLLTFKILEKTLEKKGIELVRLNDPFEKIWVNRPSLPANKIFELDVKFAGLSRVKKFELIIEKLRIIGADLQIISALDDLAWTFNLRGNDISYNPVFVGFGMVGLGINVLFADLSKFEKPLLEKLLNEGIELYNYDSFYDFLKKLSNKKVFIDPGITNMAVIESLSQNCEVIEGTSIVALLKARKNKIELEGFRKAMQKDGVALVKFLYWIKNNIGKTYMTEFTVGKKLAEFRAEDKSFKGESFTPIVGYKDHGAIVHLSVGEENANVIEKDGFLLFDSGGQYFEGTTDITRTIALGPLSNEEKRDFTLVLKGVISLTRVKFPYGTKGCHLDILARKALWDFGLNYGHGTGHGVGHFLAVHEGPMAIRQEYNPNIIEPGMVMSNEPGLYREGKYGIRTENMIVCVEKEETGFGKFLGFETLSLCPIDINAIDTELLSKEETDWLNNYHAKVRTELQPLLSHELNLFLEEITPEVK